MVDINVRRTPRLLDCLIPRRERRGVFAACPVAALRGPTWDWDLSDEASDEGNLLEIDHVEDAVPPAQSFPVSGVQHDDAPNPFLPPFARSATVP